MQFDKPKVTIDLEEYEYLKKKDEITDKNDDIYIAKEVIAALFNRHAYAHIVIELLQRGGINLKITPKGPIQWTVGEPVTAAMISFSRIETKKAP